MSRTGTKGVRRAPGRSPARGGYEPRLSAELLASVAARFLALSDASRLKVLQRICAGEASVQTVAADCALTHSNTSRHLGVLLAQGFVKRRRAGQLSLYTLAGETAERLCEVICSHLAAAGDARFGALPRH